MKKAGVILLIAGCVFLAVSVAGFILMVAEGYTDADIAAFVAIVDVTGVSAVLSLADRLQIALAKYRLIALAVGEVAVVAGAVLARQEQALQRA